MNVKFDMNVRPSSCYTCYKFRATFTSCVGGVSEDVDYLRKSWFCASFWRLTAQGMRLAIASNVGVYGSRRPKLHNS